MTSLFSIATVASVLAMVSSGMAEYSAGSTNNIAVYWATALSVIQISFMNGITPAITNFANAGDYCTPFPDNTNLLNCPQIARQQEEREEFERHRKNAKEQETVYRDATGRRIDISMKRAEARRAAAEAEEKEKLAKEALKGDVQQEEARRRREELQDAKLMPLARKADDEEMNRELKAQDRWNDPMMQFMSHKESTKKGKSKRRPVYVGAAPPNRYGIKPGYRWDGVDRGTGFEAERFKALNRQKRNEGLDYAWQMDE
ncbi:hypothetical protein NQ176_g4173 [Zarea fungicola]|uniref:Uncharacterized protein n=1 Tax=Zarea fungicola TaxID=93591 RepID=A0ACC1NFX7_9HYPO|nr:hypothetical protein NQ176_g4173 [Lecanicillium fungicola]